MTWLPDELASAGAEHLDPEYVARYERKAGYDPTDDVESLVARGVRTVVDLGAGTGVFTRAIAPHVERVVAVDVSPAMVERLRSSRPPNVEVVHAGFLSYEHRGDPVDAVFTRHALHQLPDLWKAVALRRVADLVRPGGVLLLRDLVWSCDADELPARAEQWLASASPDGEVGWTRAELEEHLTIEHSTYSWLLLPMLRRAGFVVSAREIGPFGAYLALYCIRR